MHEHIPDSANTYIMVTAEDLKSFGIKVGIWSAVGAVYMVGMAYWWESTEADRKYRREMRARKKARKEAAKRMEKQRVPGFGSDSEL